MMDSLTFWQLIESARQVSRTPPDDQIHALINALAHLPEAKIIAFEARFHHYMAIAYTSELWAAAYILNGGCSDDCFDYFRAWLIAQGEQVFHEALDDPESLADVAEIEATELEEMLSVAHIAYEQKTGNSFPHQPHPAPHMAGVPWDEATVYQRYPKLAAKWE